MARYTGPTTRIARKFGEPIYGPDKTFEKRNTPPGQHGLAAKRKKQKEYGTQLKEKHSLPPVPPPVSWSCTATSPWMVLSATSLPAR